MAMKDSTKRVAGRKIIITGAASGIGHATAVRFAEEGARVALMDVKDLGSWGAVSSDAVRIQVDLLDRPALQSAVADAGERMGGIDGVVNCAGVGGGRLFEDLDAERWDWVIGINMTAPYLICRAALPFLKKVAGSTIVNVASGAALLPNAPGGAAYSASKGGLVSFTKALALELAPHIRVNAVLPGVVDTPLTQEAVFSNYKNPNDAPFVQQYALKRVAQPRELADAILYLSSSESSYVTGIALAVDGGRTYH
jgi:NAD(P)-dependent dehydrogenase (short-subunit alcohol dehydrogenase family)